MEQNKEQSWFGYTKTNAEEKTSKVKGVFSSVADNYDLMNDLMSAGVHRLWKNRLIREIRPRADHKYLDVAGGTGDIAFKIFEATDRKADLTVFDLNPEMLRVGQDRAIDRGILKGINWVEGNAQDLPFEDNTFDVYTISFGLRNVTKIDDGIKEAYRVLKPGGRFFCLEFSKMKVPVINKIYDAYSFKIIPEIGARVAGDRDSYQYLAESIRQFPSQRQLALRMEQAGFSNVKFHNLSGGIAAIHIGHKI